MRIKKATYLVFVLLIISIKTWGQRNIKFDKITVDLGLSQSNINWILQDRQGFLWFATNGGLNRFDGTNFITYIHNKNDSNSISNNIINHIFEDEAGYLWISTQNGLNVFDKSHEVFLRFKNEPNNPNGLSSSIITCTIKDNFGCYWIGTEGGGINKYDPKSGKFKNFKTITKNLESISSNYITCIEKDKYGFIWIGTADNGVNMLNPETGKFLRYVKPSLNRSKPSISSNQINAIYEDNDGDLWIGTSEGIDMLKPTAFGRNLDNRDRIINIHKKLYPGSSSASESILNIFQGASGLIWFGTIDNGLGYINKYTLATGNYIVDPNNDFSILSNNVTAVFDDRSGILWIGTNAGINIIDRESDRFTWHKRTPGITNTLSSNNIHAIYKEGSDILWLGTFDKGLTQYDPLSEVYTNFLDNDFFVEGESIKERNRVLRKFDRRQSSKRQNKIHYLTNNRIYALHRDKSRRLWVGTGGGGLNILHINSGGIRKFTNDPESESSISSNNLRCIFEDSQGRIWIGTEDAGLNQYNQGEFIRYLSDENDIFSISSNDIRSIVEDENGFLWIGTFGGGLNKFNPENQKFTRYVHSEEKTNSLSSNSIYTLHLDKNSNLWIGTADGLNRLNIATNNFKHYNRSNGLPSNSIYKILEDNNGNIWLSTNKGISRLNKNTSAIKNYGIEDGLQSTEFNPEAGFLTRDGQMLFGGVNGYCSFYPNNITDNQYLPDIVFTDFKILSEKVPIGLPGSALIKHISETDTLELSYKDVSISFEFVALNYTDSKKNEYAFMMENFENKWNYVGNRNFADYTNLKPGKYKFRVKASNNDGVWNEEGKSIYILIKPPFWETWWFYTASSLFLFFSIFLAIQLRTRALHKSKIILEEQVKIRTQQIENQNKILEGANREILNQKSEIEIQNKLLKSKNEEISKAKKELDKTNEELISINSNLEDIVAERTSTLKLMNEELINSNNELDLFIYRASHDLKGPIARLLGMTLLAKMDNKDEALREYIELIEKGAVDINKVLNKLNNIHFINRETINREEIDFDKIIKECRSTLSNYIDRSDLKISVVTAPDFSLRSDYILMKIIMENLLENAVFFSKTKKVEIEINLRSSRKAMIISVEDNGLGILKEQQEKIFEMFYRGSEKSKGNGLGLYLVRRAVQKLHGKISVESEEGRYSCFTISLPKVIVPHELKSLLN
ncbi:MAG: ATP-binding protein [Cytophagales bacterium]|nr:ATP-binding protein [Cytophagales bacterium]